MTQNDIYPLAKVRAIIENLSYDFEIAENEKNKDKNYTVQHLLELIEPYIYGQTPMKQALQISESIFDKNPHSEKQLFILSDGESTDGDPFPVVSNIKMKHNNLHLFSCLFDDANANFNTRQLFDVESIK